MYIYIYIYIYRSIDLYLYFSISLSLLSPSLSLPLPLSLSVCCTISLRTILEDVFQEETKGISFGKIRKENIKILKYNP